jgi:erythromycin esterase
MIKASVTAWFAAVALLAAALSTSARADDPAEARQAIETQYAVLSKAALSGDMPALRDLTASDVTFVLVTGDELELGGWARLWAQIAASLEGGTVSAELQSVAVDGNAARTIVRVTFEATLKQGDTDVKYRVDNLDHGIWAKAGAKWHLRRSATIRTRSWIGGTLIEETVAKPPPEPAQRDSLAAELRARAIPLKSLTAGTGFDDLAALDAVIGDARIVALGEATHGTGEFFRMKHRLFEYLVEKKGFTVIAFEAHWPGAEIADRYVRTGEGTAAAALEELGFWIWRTREVRDLIEWMRAYNSVPGRRKTLSFSGFVMQNTETAARCVIDAFSRLGGADAEAIRRYYDGTRDLYSLMDPIGGDPATQISEDEKARLRTNVAEALKLVDARRGPLLRLLSPAQYSRARQCAVIVVQASLPGATTEAQIINARDQAMAENVKWLVEEAFPNEKVVLWAHNGHVSAGSDMPGLAPMGQQLRKIYGEQIRIIGFGFDRGAFRSKAMRQGKFVSDGSIAIKVPPAKPNSAEAVLRATGMSRFILDLRAVPASSPLGAWLAAPQPFRSIGAGYDPDMPWSGYSTVGLKQAFDALVFIDESMPSVALD